MTSSIKLNVLDQSPVFTGQSDIEAIERTVKMAKQVEEMGYHRYWVAEHHNQKAFASASPELVAARLAVETQRIRVGTAGILIGHYAPLKVAETVRMLSAFSKGRFDFGVGRAPGAVHGALEALGNHDFSASAIDAKQDATYALLRSNNSVAAAPLDAPPCECWVLGASKGSAHFAAERGLAYAFAGFANAAMAEEAVAIYRSHFKPSEQLSEPLVNFAASVYCADTEEQARYMQSSVALWSQLAEKGGQNIAFPTAKQASRQLSIYQDPEVAAMVQNNSVAGTPEQVQTILGDWVTRLVADELTLLTVTEDESDLLRHYQLMSETFL